MEKGNSLSKRTKEQSTPEDKEFEKHIFESSKKIIRSPNFNMGSNNEISIVKTEIDDLKSMFKEILTELRRNTDEVRQLKEEISKKDEN